MSPRTISAAAAACLLVGGCSSSRERSAVESHADRSEEAFVDAGAATQSCVTARTEGKLDRVNLVFMLDQSGSMGDEQHGAIFGFTKEKRWYPVTNGMKRFFGDAASAGIRASLQYFPVQKDWCDAVSYQTPDVPLTDLPNASPFIVSINAHDPLGGTPTLPAVAGAILHAKELRAKYPGERAAVVLVTDGEPSDCGTFEEVVARLEADATEIPTYVVGIGEDLKRLKTLAKAGGTGDAILVDVSDPQKTSELFAEALASIRGLTIACTVPVPKGPGGGAVEPTQLNVAIRAASGAEAVLTYDAACASPDGWRYDDVSAPTTIELCPGACERARVTAGGALEVQMGCATVGLK